MSVQTVRAGRTIDGDPPSTSALATAITRGDPVAEALFVQKCGPGLMYVLLRETRDRDLAEDLYQESFIIVIERLRKRGLEQPHKLSAFLLGVARHLVMAHRRGEARFSAAPEVLEAIQDPAPSPCENAIRAEQARTVRTAIEQLSVHRDREMLRRFYLMDQGKEAIGDLLGLSSQQFNRAVHRARQRLKQQLALA